MGCIPGGTEGVNPHDFRAGLPLRFYVLIQSDTYLKWIEIALFPIVIIGIINAICYYYHNTI